MWIVLAGDFSRSEDAAWRHALAAAMPEAHWLTPEEARADPARVQAAVVANPPPGALGGLPNLALVQSLWAGVDRLLADPTLPPQVPLARMVDPAMSAAMAETALWATLALARHFFAYARQQAAATWRQLPQRTAAEVPVLVLGQGEMGQAAAAAIARCGFPVAGWSRSGAAAGEGVHALGGDAALGRAAADAQVVINLLPLTTATRGLLDARFFAALPRGAGVVNLARGAHLVDADLLAALDGGHLGHAVLDVFASEPLAADHPFWRHPRITVLPHAAASTDPRSAAAVAAANLRAARDGAPLRHLVDRGRGY